MKIKFNDLEDEVSYTLFKGYARGANWRKNNSQPCTLCRKAKKEGVEGIRIHFHGSEFGACMLKTYLNMIEGVSEEVIKGYSAAGLSDGHAHEREIFTNLACGNCEVVPFANEDQNQKEIQVYYKKPKKGKDVEEYEFRFGKDGELKGNEKKEYQYVFNMILHLDGLYVANPQMNAEKVYGIETKSVKDYTYKKIAKTSEISDIWYGQTQAYMCWGTFTMLDIFYIIVKSRHSSDIHRPIRIKRNDAYISRRLNILYRIHRAIVEDDPEKYNIEKEHETKGASECRFCDYKERCWGSK